jgi:penicillin-binding protein 1C
MMRTELSIVILLTLAMNTAYAAPSYEDVRSARSVSDAVLMDRHGDVIHELRVDPHGRRLSWVSLADVSPALVKAVVRSEDKRFTSHHGADWTALTAAALGNLFTNNRRGASTITMQLAAMVDDGLRSRPGRRTIGQKWKQIDAARDLEQKWSKDQILEAYLNLVSFRGELQGLAAASRGLFDKDPGGLDEAESAILAALLRSPNASPEKVGERAASLAAALGNATPPDQIRSLAIDRLSRPYVVRRKMDLAPFVAQRLLHKGQRKANSTLDGSIQRFTIDTLRQVLGNLQDRNVRDGAVLVVDNRSGDVLAYVANAGGLSSSPFVDGIRARRQAGSTLKPFLYARGIENRLLTAASVLDDSPIDVPTSRGIYRPENYDRMFRGPVTVRIALASSINIPAVRTIDLVGTGALVETLQDVGFTGLDVADHYGPSLALGSADITLWDSVNAYRTLANGGVAGPLRLAEGDRSGPQRRVLSRETSFIISDILSDREARSATFSFESPLATRFWTAVKTGTSKDMRDNWCVGYSDRYTVGVWVGNFSGAPMWDVSGVSGAAPIWLEVMNYLHRDTSSRSPIAPAGVVKRTAAGAGAALTVDRQEWFIIGTEMDAVNVAHEAVRQKIHYPAPDTVIAIDPDIPTDRQKVFFRSTPPAALVLDGVPVNTASWSPVPGMHHLSLMRTDGTVVDEISFEVR